MARCAPTSFRSLPGTHTAGLAPLFASPSLDSSTLIRRLFSPAALSPSDLQIPHPPFVLRDLHRSITLCRGLVVRSLRPLDPLPFFSPLFCFTHSFIHSHGC